MAIAPAIAAFRSLNRPGMKNVFKSVGFVTLVAIAAGVYWFLKPDAVNQAHERGVSLPAEIQWLDTGLTAEERGAWHHLSEGSEVLPVSFLEALPNPVTGRSFLGSLQYYGFLAEDTDSHKLPVGFSVELRDFGDVRIPFLGINCAACHTGELRYRGRTLRIDGAPNLFALEQFFTDMRAALDDTLTNRTKAFLFARRLIQANHNSESTGEFLEVSPAVLARLNAVKHEDGLDDDEQETVSFVGEAMVKVADKDRHDLENHPVLKTAGAKDVTKGNWLRELLTTLRRFEDALKRRLETFRILAAAIDAGVDLGPGRGDSFGIIRDLLFPAEGVLLNGPVSTPALFGFKEFQYLHWDGNTTSVLQRNVAQAIALGADYDRSTYKSTVNIPNLEQLEQLALKLVPPRWPEEVFGKLDRTAAERGRTLYERLCLECHNGEKLFPLAKVGTSPLRTKNFGLELAGRPFPDQLSTLASLASSTALREHGISPQAAAKMERSTNVIWRATGGYLTRKLGGVWASPPYLHNGSVPTLHDLLSPAAQRPAKFSMNTREFDPRKVGLDVASAKGGFIFDTTLEGNHNGGHEFGTDLADDDRRALLEFLKAL